MSNIKINIPKPCARDWNTMTPKNNGKHCSFCNKVVVDFTDMRTEEIQAYFHQNAKQKTCGHFLKSQIENTGIVSGNYLNDLKIKFQKISWSPLRHLAVILISLVLSIAGCTLRTTGEIEDNSDTATNQDTPVDTLQKNDQSSNHQIKDQLTGEVSQ